MNRVQWQQLLAWIGYALRTPLHPDGLVVDFPDDVIVRANQDTPRRAPRWCSVSTLSVVGLQAGGDQIREAMRSVHRLDVLADTTPVVITMDPRNSDYGPVSAGPVTPPGGGVGPFRDAILATLQGLEGPTHPATYIADDTGDDPAILATATEAARGVWLDLASSSAEVAVVELRDVLAVHTRDLTEQTVSIHVHSVIDAAAPDPRLHAVELAQRIAVHSKSAYSTAALRSFAVCPMRRQPVRDVSGLLGGSRQETRAVLDMTVSVMRAIVEQPGTIESAEAIGTLTSANPGIPPITTTTE